MAFCVSPGTGLVSASGDGGGTPPSARVTGGERWPSGSMATTVRNNAAPGHGAIDPSDSRQLPSGRAEVKFAARGIQAFAPDDSTRAESSPMTRNEGRARPATVIRSTVCPPVAGAVAGGTMVGRGVQPKIGIAATAVAVLERLPVRSRAETEMIRP